MVGAQPGPGRARQVQWMNRPAGVPGCPPGLEYLTQINQLLVHQQIEMMERTCHNIIDLYIIIITTNH